MLPCPLCNVELFHNSASELGDIYEHPANGCAIQVAWFTATDKWIASWNRRSPPIKAGEAVPERVTEVIVEPFTDSVVLLLTGDGETLSAICDVACATKLRDKLSAALASPQPEREAADRISTLEQAVDAFADICDELGCERDNEAGLQAANSLRSALTAAEAKAARMGEALKAMLQRFELYAGPNDIHAGHHDLELLKLARSALQSEKDRESGE
jgi:hypothetical protein